MSALKEVVAEAIRQARNITVSEPADKLIRRGAIEQAEQASRELEQVREAIRDIGMIRCPRCTGLGMIEIPGDPPTLDSCPECHEAKLVLSEEAEAALSLLSDGALVVPTGGVSVPVEMVQDAISWLGRDWPKRVGITPRLALCADLAVALRDAGKEAPCLRS